MRQGWAVGGFSGLAQVRRASPAHHSTDPLQLFIFAVATGLLLLMFWSFAVHHHSVVGLRSNSCVYRFWQGPLRQPFCAGPSCRWWCVANGESWLFGNRDIVVQLRQVSWKVAIHLCPFADPLLVLTVVTCLSCLASFACLSWEIQLMDPNGSIRV